MKNLFFILGILLLIQSSFAATVQGNIYDLELNKVKGIIVEIDTIPNQKVVAVNGAYSFSSIPKGEYEITAYSIDKDLKTIEKVRIEQEGIYNRDLFLIPEISGEINESSNFWIYFLGIFVLIIIVVIFIYRFKKKPLKEERVDNDLEKVIEIIKKEGNRTTQKVIREKTGLSEAKVSLMITELEDKGIIKKIRKGRANIIILN